MVNCDYENFGCRGGHLIDAFNFLITEGTVPNQCKPYQNNKKRRLQRRFGGRALRTRFPNLLFGHGLHIFYMIVYAFKISVLFPVVVHRIEYIAYDFVCRTI